jgi:hypothetical protein
MTLQNQRRGYLSTSRTRNRIAGLLLVFFFLSQGCGLNENPKTSFNTRVDRITIQPAIKTILKGETFSLDIESTTAMGSMKKGLPYAWSTDKPDVIRVNSLRGTAQGLSVGSARVWVTLYGRKSTETAIFVVESLTVDSDDDGVSNGTDNAPYVPNPDQKDIDRDGLGDVVDTIPNFTSPVPWIQEGNLPKGLYDHAAVIWNGYLYVSGGFGPGPHVDTPDIYTYPILPDGSLGNYQVFHIPSKDLVLNSALGEVHGVATGIDGHTMIAANGYLYIIGGKFQYRRTDCYPTGTTPCNIPTPTAWNRSIFYAPIQTNGGIGLWSELPLPAGIGPYTTGAAVYNNYLYLAGGWDGDQQSNSDRVASAPLLFTGDIGDWKEEPNLPMGLSKHAVVVSQKGFLYVVGGNTGSGSSQEGYTQAFESTVYVAAVLPDNTLSHTLGPWSQTTPLPDTWIDHKAVVLGNILFVIGGRDVNEYYNQDVSSGFYYNYTLHRDVLISQIEPKDGTLSPWQTYNTLPTPLMRHTVAATEDRIYLIGGSSGQDPAMESCVGGICGAPYIRERGIFLLNFPG